MKQLVLTKETVRDLSRPELEAVGGATLHGPICCDTTGTTHNGCCDGGQSFPTGTTCVR